MAAVYATASDVAAAWRPLVTEEESTATTLLSSASVLVRAKVADVDARISAGTLEAELVKTVVVDMVIRVLQNPAGVTHQQALEYSYSFAPGSTGRRLFLTGDERSLLKAKPTKSGSRGRSIRLHRGLW